MVVVKLVLMNRGSVGFYPNIPNKPQYKYCSGSITSQVIADIAISIFMAWPIRTPPRVTINTIGGSW